MGSDAGAYAMIMWNRYNASGCETTQFVSTDIGLDENAWHELDAEGVIMELNDVIGTVKFNPVRAKQYLKID